MDFIKILARDLQSVGYPDWIITSYIRPDGTHASGKAIDIIPRGIPLSEYPRVFYDISKLSNRYYIAFSWPNNVHFHITLFNPGLGMELWRGKQGLFKRITSVNKRFFTKNKYYIIVDNKEYNL